MNEDSFDESTLSAEDLAVLRAFDAIESWESYPADTTSSTQESNTTKTMPSAEPDDMLPTFLAEVEEDIFSMLNALQQLEQEGYTQPAHFSAPQRIGHKMRGTAGAMGYLYMSEVASHIEIIAEQVVYHMLQPAIGGEAIAHATAVLESCLYKLVQDNQELADDSLVADLLAFYADLSIDLDQPIREDLPPLPISTRAKKEASPLASPTSRSPFQLTAEASATYAPTNSQALQEGYEQATYANATRSFDSLLLHSEKLLAQYASIENAYKQVESAFQDLQVAQAHFQHLEMLFSSSLAQEHVSQLPEDLTSSSLITRILNNAAPRDGSRPRRARTNKTLSPSQQSSAWDELDIEHYSPRDMLLRSLREAIVNVEACSARLKTAHYTMHKLQQEYMENVSLIREDALSMRLSPLSAILPQLRDAVMASVLAKEGQIDFEVIGDDVEVDREVLSSLSPLLMHLLQTCIDNVTVPKRQSSALAQAGRIWLHTSIVANEVLLEIGFSMPVRGGALQLLRERLRLLNGSISLERNTVGGISFFLRIPRIRDLLRCLLVRVADQQLLIPLSHVQNVGYTGQLETAASYHLGSLLGISLPTASHPNALQQVVFMQLPAVYTRHEPLKIIVDEIIDEIELMVRPFPPYLRRPGIISSTIDGKGNVLLLLDVAELVGNYAKIETVVQTKSTQPLKILVADDSASFRSSILQTLRHTTYQVSEAHDGLEALEILKTDPPDIILLDVEMPYLNGYDLLDVLRQNSQFSTIKIIMLTSRTSEKHVQHALNLGAHAYLTKPSSAEKLLVTIQQFRPLARTNNG